MGSRGRLAALAPLASPEIIPAVCRASPGLGDRGVRCEKSTPDSPIHPTRVKNSIKQKGKVISPTGFELFPSNLENSWENCLPGRRGIFYNWVKLSKLSVSQTQSSRDSQCFFKI